MIQNLCVIFPALKDLIFPLLVLQVLIVAQVILSAFVCYQYILHQLDLK